MSGPKPLGAAGGDSGIRVVRGNPADDELAAAITAVLAVVAASGGGAAAPAGRGQGRWAAPAARMTRRPARDGWG
ncbi:acyl-CoA carboxylase epsilon subunit [Streptomyces profundus]|uniref:acyl-CoA carboxylase epsilon subunit n=1 Tax=Streptomyces profundus TaxID=2867410 RepID=UPI001D16463D|nr:acyl-CoA carboxylase epsilon subunit [Streptomyces sp. MA3_2.13]UED84062.1 acyl-CoA carboxylase subunit epsilon [Streptomyces sp. MA3_2.13]